MNYLIGTSMQLDIRIIALFFAFTLSSCLLFGPSDEETVTEIVVENDTDKVLEIVGFPFPAIPRARIFRDTVRVAPSLTFTARGQSRDENPSFHDSVRIFWGDMYVRTDVNLGEFTPSPSFFAILEIWSRFDCGDGCTGIKLKASDLKLDEPNE